MLPLSSPLLHLIHGLPGSVKTQVLTWVRTYFADVWHWKYAEEFCFLAPPNSMVSNIGGSTVHSWGQVGFKDRRGVHIAPKTRQDEETPTMTVKCGKLRFLFIDEIEATGADTIGALEAHVAFHASRQSPYKFATKREDNGKVTTDLVPRCFGGVNVFFLGYFDSLSN